MENFESSWADVRNYLNYLYDLKKSIKYPMSMEKDDNLYHIFDGDGNLRFSCSEKIYEIFQELR